jgi:ubiquitin
LKKQLLKSTAANAQNAKNRHANARFSGLSVSALTLSATKNKDAFLYD